MTFTVEDGTGLVLANAYATVNEVDAILGVNIHSKWSLIVDTTTKQNLIMWASRILDERVKWDGKKTYDTSGLAWPRMKVKDKENTPIDDNVVPRQVKVATALLADTLLSNDVELPNSSGNMSMLQVDVVILRFDARLAVQKYPVEISLALQGLGWVSFGRGGGKRIIKH